MSIIQLQPRLIRLRDAPSYLGMDRNRFNTEVRPSLTEIPIGEQGIAFDRLDLDAWVDHYKELNGRPALRRSVWDVKKMPGLTKRGEFWHINKKVDGIRICESTKANRLEEAEKYLVQKLETIRQAKIYGVRPRRIFRQAATKFLLENQHKKSIKSDKDTLLILDPYIGDLPLEAIHMGSLQYYINSRRKRNVKNRTINFGLQLVRHILNLAASEWMDEFGLASAPKIKLLAESDARKPYPLDWDEQDRLFAVLPSHLKIWLYLL